MGIISFDFFGSLARRPIFWREFLKYLKLEGMKIHIISGPWPADLTRRLESHGYKPKIHYDEIHSILTYLSDLGVDTWFDEKHDSWYSDNDAWWVSKAAMCKSISAQIHFDSDLRFGKAFTYIATRFVSTNTNTGRAIAESWHNRLKLANTYGDDLDDEYHRIMGGFIPG